VERNMDSLCWDRQRMNISQVPPRIAIHVTSDFSLVKGHQAWGLALLAEDWWSKDSPQWERRLPASNPTLR
jgi:hypothetical protein